MELYGREYHSASCQICCRLSFKFIEFIERIAAMMEILEKELCWETRHFPPARVSGRFRGNRVDFLTSRNVWEVLQLFHILVDLVRKIYANWPTSMTIWTPRSEFNSFHELARNDPFWNYESALNSKTDRYLVQVTCFGNGGWNDETFQMWRWSIFGHRSMFGFWMANSWNGTIGKMAENCGRGGKSIVNDESIPLIIFDFFSSGGFL